jgi:hypothetical protein
LQALKQAAALFVGWAARLTECHESKTRRFDACGPATAVGPTSSGQGAIDNSGTDLLCKG